MPDFKKLLTPFVGVVTVLFGAFDSFLVRIAPPDETGLSFAVGILPFLVLLVLLFIAAASQQASAAKYRRRWIASGVVFFLLAVPAVYLYPITFGRYTYISPGGAKTRRVCASSDYLTPQAAQYVQENPDDSTPAQLSRNFPTDELIWEKRGLEIAQQRLLGNYAWLVLALCSAILSFLEVISGGTMTSLVRRHKSAARAAGPVRTRRAG
jgi:hypothetical protein